MKHYKEMAVRLAKHEVTSIFIIRGICRQPCFRRCWFPRADL